MNVVLTGECGTGKSSLINLIVGQDVATTSNDSTACTTDVHAYGASINGHSVKLLDTPGFNEGYTRTGANNVRSLETLIQSLHKLATRKDIHLLIYCMNGNRAKAAHLKHYETIRAFLPAKVPMVAVVTRLERYQSCMEDWWSINAQGLSSLGMTFADHACITAIPDSNGLCPSFRERRLDSQRAVRDLISRNHISQLRPVKFPIFPISNPAVPEQKGPEHAGLQSVSMQIASHRARVAIHLRAPALFA